MSNNERVSDRGNSFSRVENILHAQIRLAEEGRFEEIASMMNDLQEEISAATYHAGQANSQRAGEIKRLYDRLCITLTAHKKDISTTLTGLNNSNKLTQTYKKYTTY